MRALHRELTSALRRLARRPWLSAVAIAILALGVGAATFVASAVDTVGRAAVPYPDPETLIDVRCSYREVVDSTRSMAPADFLSFERALERGAGADGGLFDALGAYVPFGEGDLVAPGREPVRLAVRQVSEGLLAALEIRAEAGRLFLADDFREGAPPAALLSYRLWQSRFGAGPGVVGETILLDGEERVVRGVLPERFRIPGGEADAVLPLVWSAADVDDRSSAYLGGIGRLRPGTSLEQVRAALDGVARRLEEEHPESNDGVGAHAAPLQEMFTAQARRPLAFLAAAAALLLLVAGLNLSGLQVVRTLDRRRELAVRLALGAPRSRLIAGLLLDGALVAVAGWAFGLGIAHSALGALPRLQGVYVPSGFEAGLSPGVVTFAGVVAAAAALLPVLGAARALPEAGAGVSGEGRGGFVGPGGRPGGGLGRRGPSAWLPVAQVALTCAVLVSGGLLLRSSLALGAVRPGEAPERVVTFELSLPESRYGDSGAPAAFFDRLAERLSGRPDVVAVAAAYALPPAGGWSYAPEVEGRELPKEVSVDWQVIAGDYFAALGVPVLRGRSFLPSDRADSRPVMVIDRGAARRLFGEEDPLGSRVRFNGEWHEVVGVVASQPSVDPWDQPTVYVAHGQSPVPGSFLRNLEVAVRVRSAPEALLADAGREVATVDPLLAAASVQTLDRRMATGVRHLRGRYHAVLAGVLGALALLLSAVGVFAVQAFQVRRRTREIGIRMAVGARIAQVVRLVLGRGLRIAVAGTVLGLLASLSLSNLLEQLLFGVEPADPLTLAAVAGLLAVTVLVASAVPAAWAARIDPMVTLRSE